MNSASSRSVAARAAHTRRAWPAAWALPRLSAPARTRALVIAIAVLGLALRVWRLDFQPLWFDEGYTVYFATRPLGELAWLTARDIHPPLYYALLHVWMGLAGRSDVAVRLLSALLGAAALPVMFALGKRLWGTTVGLTAATLLAVAPMHLYASQEARMYPLATLLTLGATMLALGLLEEKAGDKRWWVGYIVLSTASMYTFYFAAFVPVFHYLLALWKCRRDWRAFRPWLAAGVAIILLYSPWLVYAASALTTYVQGKVSFEAYPSLSLVEYLSRCFTAFSLGNEVQAVAAGGLAALGSLALVGLGLRAVCTSPVSREQQLTGANRAWFLLLYFAAPVTLGWLVNLRFPFFFPRLFLIAAPPLYLAWAAGLVWLVRCSRFWAVVAAVTLAAALAVSLGFYYITPRYAANDYRPLVSKLAALGRPDDAVVAVYPWQLGFLYSYYPGMPPEGYLAPAADWDADPAAMQAGLQATLEGRERVWLLAYQVLGRQFESKLERYLADNAYSVSSEWTGDTRLYMYGLGTPSRAAAATVNFEDRATLASYTISEGTVEAAGGVVSVELHWRLDKVPDRDYRVGLRLTDAQGRTWGQHDSAPVGGLVPFTSLAAGTELADRHGLLMPAGTPPGTYTVELGLYPPNATSGLNVLDANRIPQGTSVKLGQIQVKKPQRAVPLEALFMQERRIIDFGGAPALVGFSTGDRTLAPGGALAVTLFWQARWQPQQDFRLNLALRDAAGQTWAALSDSLLADNYPTLFWVRDELVRAQFSLPVRAAAPNGPAALYLTVTDEQGRPLAPDAHLADFTVQGRQHYFSAQRPVPNLVQMPLGESAELLGYEVSVRQVKPGEKLRVTLWWRSRAETDKSYTAFVHLLDAKGIVAAQQDSVPGQGTLPTTGWVTGEVLEDGYDLTIKPETAPGPLSVEVGMYDAATGQRLVFGNDADHLIIGTVTVAP